MKEQIDICEYINMTEEEVKEVLKSIPSEDMVNLKGGNNE
jgi:uncharacterized FlaG/YvyC family protein